jgi:3-oxoacyl-[acyl-carrier protein] reductase
MFAATLVATQAALKHMKNGGRIIMIGSSVGERVMVPRAGALLGHEGSHKDVHSGVVQRGGEPGHHGQQRPAGSDRHGFESRAGDWAVPQKAATALDRYGHVDEVAALVAFVAGPEASYITGANLTVDGGTNA